MTGQNLDAELKAEGAATYMAPPDENLKCKTTSSSEEQALNAVIGIPEGTDYLSLEEVPTGVSLFDTFNNQFTGERGPKGELYQARTIFSAIANCVDKAKRESRELPRICLQDESRLAKGFSFDGLIIDVIDARMMNSDSPLLVLAMSRSEDMNASSKGIFKDGFQIEVFRKKPSEIDLFVKIVEANAARLSNSEDDFIFNGVKILKDHSVFKIGVAIPITATESEKYYELLGKHCSFCGNSNGKLFKCTGCKTVHYCGRPCQKGDWKFHKLVCSASSKK
ncbi:hypothetical protein CTEN210_13379 [Chaetoceros tenuissimus]|uniref:MYND-type domain-containing protein n=1 Tax=Chaetoceros tenuissimus TaxID=426638 RepID=A0AAD3D382_9STRA|nr:hypothetical protein CTEN210_13379 [Chaetoceros tenuissimus]